LRSIALLVGFIGAASAFAGPPMTGRPIGLRHNPKGPTHQLWLNSQPPKSEHGPPIEGPQSGSEKSSLLNKDQESKKNGCCPSEKEKREKRMAIARNNGFCTAMEGAMKTYLLNNGITDNS